MSPPLTAEETATNERYVRPTHRCCVHLPTYLSQYSTSRLSIWHLILHPHPPALALPGGATSEALKSMSSTRVPDRWYSASSVNILNILCVSVYPSLRLFSTRRCESPSRQTSPGRTPSCLPRLKRKHSHGQSSSHRSFCLRPASSLLLIAQTSNRRLC